MTTGEPHALLTRVEAAGRLRIGLTLLHELTQTGRLRSITINRRRFYRACDLEAYIEHQAATQ